MSDTGHDRSLSELEREAERTRAELMTTVDALRRRVSPGALKEDAKDYIRHTGEGFLGGLQQRARENPLQAVAIAAGLAFPVWRMATSIPVPLMLIGAGLALGRAGSGGNGQSYGGELYQRARDTVQQAAGTVRERAHDAKDAVQSALSSATDTMGDAAGQMAAGVGDARERAGDRASAAASAAGGLVSKAAALPSQIYGSAAEAAQSGMQSARSGAEQVRDATYRRVEQARDAAYHGAAEMRSRGERMQHDLVATIERNPLLVGMLGLAAGAVVAAAFPTSRVENRMFGETSDAMKERAQELAQDGVQRARSAAADLYEQALEEARAQGVGPEALRDAVKELGERAKTAAKNAAGAGRTAQPDMSTTH